MSSSFQTVPLWLLPLWMSALVLILVMGPHLRNERFFIGFFVVWPTVNSLSSYCPYFFIGVYRSTGTWSLPHHHPTFSTLHVSVYIVLFQRLWLFVTTLLISCCLICYRAGQLVEFLKPATSLTHTQHSSSLFAHLVCFF